MNKNPFIDYLYNTLNCYQKAYVVSKSVPMPYGLEFEDGYVTTDLDNIDDFIYAMKYKDGKYLKKINKIYSSVGYLPDYFRINDELDSDLGKIANDYILFLKYAEKNFFINISENENNIYFKENSVEDSRSLVIVNEELDVTITIKITKTKINTQAINDDPIFGFLLDSADNSDKIEFINIIINRTNSYTTEFNYIYDPNYSYEPEDENKLVVSNAKLLVSRAIKKEYDKLCYYILKNFYKV